MFCSFKAGLHQLVVLCRESDFVYAPAFCARCLLASTLTRCSAGVFLCVCMHALPAGCRHMYVCHCTELMTGCEDVRQPCAAIDDASLVSNGLHCVTEDPSSGLCYTNEATLHLDKSSGFSNQSLLLQHAVVLLPAECSTQTLSASHALTRHLHNKAPMLCMLRSNLLLLQMRPLLYVSAAFRS